MAKNKTSQTEQSVSDFVNAVPDETKRSDSHELIRIMQEATGFEPKMWGPSIIGFGSYHYKYESGHDGDAPLAGFSPRSAAISLYIADFPERDELLDQLGKYKPAKACIYVKKLKDVDQQVLARLVTASVEYIKTCYPAG